MGHIRADQHEPICLWAGAGTPEGCLAAMWRGRMLDIGVFSRWCPNSASKQCFAFRLCWQLSRKKIPRFACLGVCTSFSSAMYRQCKWNWAAGSAGRQSSNDLPGQTCHCSRAIAEPRHPLPRGQLLPTAWLWCAPSDGCLASSLPGPARFSGKEAVLQTAELLSCVLLRRTSHAPDTSKCVTLSPHGSAGILLLEFAMLGRFLPGRARPTGAGGVGSSRMWHLQEAETCQEVKLDVPARSPVSPGTGRSPLVLTSLTSSCCAPSRDVFVMGLEGASSA